MNATLQSGGTDEWKPRAIPAVVFDGLFLSMLIGYLFWGMTRVPFYGDESTFVRLSKDFVYLFQDHDIQRVVYRSFSEEETKEPFTDEYLEQYNRLLTGAINPLTIGLAWNAAGIHREELNGFWLWWSPADTNQWKFNVAGGNMPSPRLLSIARLPSTVFTAASIIAVFIIALVLSHSRPAAWVAAFLYATSPSVLGNGRMALQEGSLLLFSALIVLCALSLIRLLREGTPRWRRILPGYGLLGLTSGLALAAKHNSALIIAPIFLAVFILIGSAGTGLEGRERKAAQFHLLSGLLGAGLLGLSVFYFLMPVWWIYPYNGLALLSLSAACFGFAFPTAGRWVWIFRAASAAMVLLISLSAPRAWIGIYRSVRITAQARTDLIRAAERASGTLTTWESRLGEMADQLLFAKAEFWDVTEESQAQIQSYEDSHLDGRKGGAVWGIVMLVLVAAGLWVALVRRRRWESLLLILWLVIPASVILLANSLPWQRYYIILIAPWSILAGFGVVPLSSVNVGQWVQKIRPGRG